MTDAFSVCYFGAYRPDYPRNLTIRRALALARVPVVECRVPPQWPNVRRWPALTAQFWSDKAARTAAVIVVAEFCHTLVPLAWLLSRITGAALMFDPGISFYDEMVVCQRATPPGSLRAAYLRALDNWAFRLPEMVVWFTPVDEEYFGNIYHIPPHRSTWIPPGVDESLFLHSDLPESDSPFIVHWDGSFIPSHGVEVILEAASLLLDQPDIRFELVGDGPMAKAMKLQAERMNLSNVVFAGRVSAEELVDSVRRAHICLGAFRADDKQRRSLYTKELQAMFAGRPLVTADGEAKRRIFTPQRDLWLLPPNAPSELARAILTLRANPANRQSLAKRGHAAVLALSTSAAIQQRVVAVLERSTVERRRRGVVGQNPHPPL